MDDKGWDGWMVSLTHWTWVWASSGRWWRTGKPGMLQSMGSQRDRTEQLSNSNKTDEKGGASQVALGVGNLPAETTGSRFTYIYMYKFSSVTQSCLSLCDPMDCSMPGFPVYHQLPELAQTHVRQVSDALQPSHPLSSPSPPAFNLTQHLGLFQWVSWNVYIYLILHQIAHKILRSYCKAKTEVKIKINLTEKVPSAQQAFPDPRKINLSFRPWTRLKMISEWQCP